jgi:hypothetical protein
MAFFSTWDWNKNAWRIYRTPETVSVGDDPTPPRPTGLNVLGADPDAGVRPLPANAAFVGYDHMARGEIRRAAGVGGLGDASSDSSLMRDAGLILLGAAGAMVFAKYYGERQ